MIYFAIILILLNLLSAYALRGRPKDSSDNPILTRVSYFSYGIFAALLYTGYEWDYNKSASWLIITILLLITLLNLNYLKKSLLLKSNKTNL